MFDHRAQRSAPRRGQRIARAAIAIATAVVVSTALGQSHVHGTTTVVGHDYGFEGPAQLNPGWHYITFRNEGNEHHHLQFMRLNEGVTLDEFFAALRSEGEAAMRFVTATGGVGHIPPGTSAEVLVDFTQPGTYVELCFIPNAEGVPHLALGMIGVVQVVGEPTATPEPTADIEVRMFDFNYSIPATITSGLHTWKIVNDGPQLHEMTVLKLNEGASVDDFMAAMAGGPGALPGEAIGGAQGLNTGYASYIDYDLEAGTYVAYCMVSDPASGRPHLVLGMFAPFVVAEAAAEN